MLTEMGYSLQANRKTSEGKIDHPDRNEQFLYISKQPKLFLKRGQPVISVDTKKKELVGNCKNPGQEWKKKRKPVKVLSHDFPDPKIPKAVPYGVYDIGKNVGWVNVGISSDTAEFAVESIRQWWKKMGNKKYTTTKGLLITADSGGSNGYRLNLWKRELQELGTANGLGDYHKAYDFFVCAGFNNESAVELATEITQKFARDIIKNCLTSYGPIAPTWVQTCKK